MLNLLLVEDEDFFREALCNVLRGQGWTVAEAHNGKVARDVIKASPPFDLIISDIQMPFLSGIELLGWVKENKPTPVVLMTGFALILETEKAHEMGADDFLSKPFEANEMVEVVKRICNAKLAVPASSTSAPKEEFCKVSLEEFVTSPQIKFDVYVKLGSRYLKIGRKGDAIPIERIKNYREKGLKYLHVRREDFRTLVSFNLDLARVVSAADSISLEKKTNFLRYTGEVILEKTFIAGVDPESFAEAREFLVTSMDVLTEEPTAFDLLQSLNAYSDHIYAHSLCVSLYSVMIAKKMKWTSSHNLFKLSVAGIYHDIGKKEIEPELINKARPLLSYAERKIVETHPIRGREILLALKQIPSEAVAVAFEHHEDNMGTGYPRMINKMAIHPYSQIVRVANLFAEYCLKSPHHPGMPAKQAIEHIDIHYRETVSHEAFDALKSLFA